MNHYWYGQLLQAIVFIGLCCFLVLAFKVAVFFQDRAWEKFLKRGSK